MITYKRQRQQIIWFILDVYVSLNSNMKTCHDVYENTLKCRTLSLILLREFNFRKDVPVIYKYAIYDCTHILPR